MALALFFTIPLLMITSTGALAYDVSERERAQNVYEKFMDGSASEGEIIKLLGQPDRKEKKFGSGEVWYYEKVKVNGIDLIYESDLELKLIKGKYYPDHLKSAWWIGILQFVFFPIFFVLDFIKNRAALYPVALGSFFGIFMFKESEFKYLCIYMLAGSVIILLLGL